MRKAILLLAACSVFLAGKTWAKEDNNIIVKFDHNGPKDSLSVASVYLTFKENKVEGLPGVPSGDETRFSAKLWEGLFLQVTTQTGEQGVEGYHFAFSKDEAYQDPLTTVDAPLQDLAAADFRTEDNSASRPIKPGPGTFKDRGILRILHYPGFDAEIRVLEYNIGDAEEDKSPYFKSASCLVTVRQKNAEPKKEAKEIKGGTQ